MSKNRLTHGKSQSRAYQAWSGMRTRCYNGNAKSYPYYGGRGIKVCQRWLESFEGFYADMGEADVGMSLERIDVNGDYSPENCKWIPLAEQARNKRNVKLIDGKTLPEIARESGVKYSTLHARKRTDIESTVNADLRRSEYACNGESRTISEWADKQGVQRHTIYKRLHRGWPLERALGVSA